jgi:hypothetical protein
MDCCNKNNSTVDTAPDTKHHDELLEQIRRKIHFMRPLETGEKEFIKSHNALSKTDLINIIMLYDETQQNPT